MPMFQAFNPTYAATSNQPFAIATAVLTSASVDASATAFNQGFRGLYIHVSTSLTIRGWDGVDTAFNDIRPGAILWVGGALVVGLSTSVVGVR